MRANVSSPGRESRTSAEHGAGGDDWSLAGLHGFSIKVPDVGILVVVGVRIAGEDVGRDVAGEVPHATVVLSFGKDEFEIGEVAGVVAVARADDEGNQVAGMDGDRRNRAEFHGFSALGDAGREALAGGSTSQFDGPRDAVAAFGMGVGDGPFDLQGRRAAGFSSRPRRRASAADERRRRGLSDFQECECVDRWNWRAKWAGRANPSPGRRSSFRSF